MGLRAGAPSLAAQTAPNEHEHAAQTAPSGGHMMMSGQMMADMNAKEAKLDQLVAEMNAAKGDAKVSAIAAVVTEMVNQEKAMHSQCEMMKAMKK
jgi:hypothetical protein